MKIAIDVSQMCYEGTGVARYVHGLTKALLESNSGHEFILYAGTLRRRSYFKAIQQTSPWSKASWRILPLPPKLAGYALNLLPFRAEWLVGAVDLFHSSDWSEVSSKCPSTTTIHDLVFELYPETVDPLIYKIQTQRLKKIVKDNTHIIVDSKSTKNDLVKIYNINKQRIDVIYPGLDLRYLPQKKSEIDRVKKIYHLPDQFILSVGTQEPRKNLASLTQAVHDLDIPLVLVGKHGWGDQTKTLGYIPESDLPGIYSAATVFAYPSLYEGFGFPVLEAMACGTPVVTSNVSSLPEVAGSAAILVDPTDVASISSGIVKAIKDHESLSKKGLAQAKKFTWDRTAEAVLEVYEKITHRD